MIKSIRAAREVRLDGLIVSKRTTQWLRTILVSRLTTRARGRWRSRTALIRDATRVFGRAHHVFSVHVYVRDGCASLLSKRVTLSVSLSEFTFIPGNLWKCPVFSIVVSTMCGWSRSCNIVVILFCRHDKIKKTIILLYLSAVVIFYDLNDVVINCFLRVVDLRLL